MPKAGLRGDLLRSVLVAAEKKQGHTTDIEQNFEVEIRAGTDLEIFINRQ